MSKLTDTITASLLEIMDKGQIPWARPWGKDCDGTPRNGASGHKYRGINRVLLMSTHAYDGRWYTYKGANECGGQVKRGEHAKLIVFGGRVPKKILDESTGEESTVMVNTFKAFFVFNRTQCEWPNAATSEPVKSQGTDYQTAEAILATCGIPIQEGAAAYYDPMNDSITLPPRSAFASLDFYFATAFHELTHATGHATRLKREQSGERAKYAYEELIAELGAAFLCAECGIPNDGKQSAAYLQSWSKAMRGDSTFIVSAASAAEKALDLVMGRAAK